MEKSIDGFLIDLNMPGLDGADLCRRIRAMERHRLTPIICVTAQNDEYSISSAFFSRCGRFHQQTGQPDDAQGPLVGAPAKLDYMLEMEKDPYQPQPLYLPPHANHGRGVFDHRRTTDTRGAGPVRIVFRCAGVTQLSQEVEASTLFNVLSNHLGMQVDCVYRHGGYIDKFAGDGIMAVFDSDKRVQQACECALEIIDLTKAGAEHSNDQILEFGNWDPRWNGLGR